MKKLVTATLVGVVLLTSGCFSRQGVEVVKMPETSNAVQPAPNPYSNMAIVNGQVVVQSQTVSAPNQNVKAICRDGSYALEINEHTCLGHGGVAIGTQRYHAD